jgi:hypothetical protein
MIDYVYNSKSKILEVKVSGDLNIEGIIGHYNRIARNDALPDTLKILIDCRSAAFDVDINSIESTTEAVKESLKKYKIIKEAILVDKPFETAVAKVFQLFNSKIENYSFEVFSTEDASRNWLL